MRVRVYVDIDDQDQMRRIVHGMLTGGYTYGGVTPDSPRKVLMERVRMYLADNGGTMIDDPDEWHEDTARVTCRLWRD